MGVAINRVYTGVGDRGTTRLAGGQEVSKTALRIEAYGTIDELNACLGMVAERLSEEMTGASASSEEDARFFDEVRRVQNELFDLGGELAVLPEDRHEKQILVCAQDVERLEAELDRVNEVLPGLRSFVLPGGGMLSALIHQARTVCRRAERRLVALHQEEPQRDVVLQYVNRLSDWLFVMGRHAAAGRGACRGALATRRSRLTGQGRDQRPRPRFGSMASTRPPFSSAKTFRVPASIVLMSMS